MRFNANEPTSIANLKGYPDTKTRSKNNKQAKQSKAKNTQRNNYVIILITMVELLMESKMDV